MTYVTIPRKRKRSTQKRGQQHLHAAAAAPEGEIAKPLCGADAPYAVRDCDVTCPRCAELMRNPLAGAL